MIGDQHSLEEMLEFLIRIKRLADSA